MDRMRSPVESPDRSSVPPPGADPAAARTAARHNRGGGVAVYPRLAALAVLIAFASLLLGDATASAQTPTNETVFSTTAYTTSSTNSQVRAHGFTTGSSSATLSKVNLRLGHSGTTTAVNIWSNHADNHPGSKLVALTNPTSLNAGTRAFTAPANTTLAANTTYWVVVNDAITTGKKDFGLAVSTSADVLHGWSAVGAKTLSGAAWIGSNSGLELEIIAAVHSGTAQDGDDDYQSLDYEPLPECTEEQRQRRQRPGEWPPPDCRGGFYHAWEIPAHLISDPCDQVWQVPGSYRPDRGCLNRPEGSYTYTGPTGPREVPSPPPEPVYEYFPVEDANGNCCISERRRVR